jgi:hypothetical protein
MIECCPRGTMSTLVRIGERLYEFSKSDDIEKARGIYARFTGNQNSFEDEMENAGIDFLIDPN